MTSSALGPDFDVDEYSRSMMRRSGSTVQQRGVSVSDRAGDEELTRVLMLYTGGTIGMVQKDNGSLAPARGFLGNHLASQRAFHDPAYARFTTPKTRLGGRIYYEIIEYDPLIDSSNVNATHWTTIVKDIEERYDDWDAFVILHGTDTLAYTASALSFMLMNLGKSVILTGSLIPLSQEPNDAIDNLGGALLIAGHFDIPEVAIFFRGQLFRGNRTTKLGASGMNAFSSGNCPPLAQVGLYVNVRWDIVRKPEETEQARGFKVHTDLETNVGVVTVFPGIQATQLRHLLAPPLKGCVLRTFGSGNMPNDEELYSVLREATSRGVVIVNVTQCFTGTVIQGHYAVSENLNATKVTSGSDMTTEAALTKLMWLLGRHPNDVETVRARMEQEIRGELRSALPQSRRSWRDDGKQRKYQTTNSARKSASLQAKKTAETSTSASKPNSPTVLSATGQRSSSSSSRSSSGSGGGSSSSSSSSSKPVVVRPISTQSHYAASRAASLGEIARQSHSPIDGGMLEPLQHATFVGSQLQAPSEPPARFVAYNAPHDDLDDVSVAARSQLSSSVGSWPSLANQFTDIVSQDAFFAGRLSYESRPTAAAEAAFATVAANYSGSPGASTTTTTTTTTTTHVTPNNKTLPSVPHFVCVEKPAPLVESKD